MRDFGIYRLRRFYSVYGTVMRARTLVTTKRPAATEDASELFAGRIDHCRGYLFENVKGIENHPHYVGYPYLQSYLDIQSRKVRVNI